MIATDRRRRSMALDIAPAVAAVGECPVETAG